VFSRITELLNDTAPLWWDWIAPTTTQAVLLGLIVLGADILLRRWIWPQMLHALWLLVFAKLLFPPSLTSPLSLIGWFTRNQPSASTALTTAPMQLPQFMTSQLATESTAFGGQAASIIMPVAAPISSLAILLVMWALGVVFFASWTLFQIVAVRRLQRESETPSPYVIEAASDAALAVGLRRPPSVRIGQSVVSAAVFGVFRPVILLAPGTESSVVRHILLHECAHIRRGDLIIHAAGTLLLILNWWNPLIWFARRRVHHWREPCADALVAGVLRNDTVSYRRTLLHEAVRYLERQPHSQPAAIGLLGLLEGPHMILTRLRRLEHHVWRFARLRMVLVLAMLAVMAVAVLPMAQGVAHYSKGLLLTDEAFDDYLTQRETWDEALMGAWGPGSRREIWRRNRWETPPSGEQVEHARVYVAELPDYSDPDVLARTFTDIPSQRATFNKVVKTLYDSDLPVGIRALDRSERHEIMAQHQRFWNSNGEFLRRVKNKPYPIGVGFGTEYAIHVTVDKALVDAFPDAPRTPLSDTSPTYLWPRPERERFVSWLIERGDVLPQHLPHYLTDPNYEQEWYSAGNAYLFTDVDVAPHHTNNPPVHRPDSVPQDSEASAWLSVTVDESGAPSAVKIYRTEIRSLDRTVSHLPAQMNQVVVDGNTVTNPDSTDSETRKSFAEAAENTARQFAYRPALLHGEPVRCTVFERIDFTQ
jgi:beta-lactamase regulating signal transducer with metallopeptidase domain